MENSVLAGIVEEFGAVFGPAATLVVVTGPDSRIAWANDAALGGFGELVGSPLLGVIPLPLRAVFRRQLDDVVSGEAATASFDTITLDRFGNQAAIAITLVRLEPEEGLLGILGLLRAPPAPVPGDLAAAVDALT